MSLRDDDWVHRFDTVAAVTGWLRRNVRNVVIGYPLTMLVVLFVVPSFYLFATSFFPRDAGNYYQIGFTLDHYIRMTSSTYLRYFVTTLKLAGITAIVSLVLGYPVAYWVARTESKKIRDLFMFSLVATMWLTVIIRAYSIQVILASNGIVNQFLMGIGIVDSAVTSGTGLFATVAGMVYGFLPFAILTMYTSINNIDTELEEASRNLGASKLQTIRRITLPLSKNGIAAAGALVFILSIGSYVVPRLLGTPDEWTLPVIITREVTSNLNVPFGAAMAVVLTALTVVLFWAAVRFLGLGSQEIVGDEFEGETDG